MSFSLRLRLALLPPPSFMPNTSSHPSSSYPQEYERETVTEDPKHYQQAHRLPDVQVADACEVRLHVQIHGRVDGSSSRSGVDNVEHLERVYASENYDYDEERLQEGYDQMPHFSNVAGPVHPGRLKYLGGDGLHAGQQDQYDEGRVNPGVYKHHREQGRARRAEPVEGGEPDAVQQVVEHSVGDHHHPPHHAGD